MDFSRFFSRKREKGAFNATPARRNVKWLKRETLIDFLLSKLTSVKSRPKLLLSQIAKFSSNIQPRRGSLVFLCHPIDCIAVSFQPVCKQTPFGSSSSNVASTHYLKLHVI